MSEYDPGLHAEHAVALATAENVPGKQDEHAVEVAFAANLPAEHAVHDVAPTVSHDNASFLMSESGGINTHPSNSLTHSVNPARKKALGAATTLSLPAFTRRTSCSSPRVSMVV